MFRDLKYSESWSSKIFSEMFLKIEIWQPMQRTYTQKMVWAISVIQIRKYVCKSAFSFIQYDTRQTGTYVYSTSSAACIWTCIVHLMRQTMGGVWLWNLMNRKKLTVSNTMRVGTKCNNHLWWWWWWLCTFEFHNRNISMMTVFCVEDLTASIFRMMVTQAASYSEMLVHIPEGSHLHSCQNENIKARLENFCNI